MMVHSVDAKMLHRLRRSSEFPPRGVRLPTDKTRRSGLVLEQGHEWLRSSDKHYAG